MTKQSNIFLTLVRKGGVTFFLLQVINSALEKKEMQWQILAFIKSRYLFIDISDFYKSNFFVDKNVFLSCLGSKYQ